MSAIRSNIDSLVEGFYQLGIRQWIISPGSRNAPIVASIVKQGKFKLFSQADERSAAFLGLGANMAEVPTGIICTSGTAVLNYYPAICEAYYAQIPLLVVSADRPKYLIDQWDGQTIRQNAVFSQHIKSSYSIEGDIHDENTLSEILEILNGVNMDMHSFDKGPVHINIPLSEPIYEGVDSPWSAKLITLNKDEIEGVQSQEISFKGNAVLFIGELSPREAEQLSMDRLSEHFPILAEATSNIIIENTNGWEINSRLLSILPAPDVLITMGKNFVSKAFKQFIHAHSDIEHYHLHTNLYVGNPFKTRIQSFRFDSMDDISQILRNAKNNRTFNNSWISQIQPDSEKVHKALDISGELRAINSVFNAKFDSVFIGNSTPIRLAALLPRPNKKMFCNRGTSGIDGCVSTAVGYALAKPQEKVACIVGDISFLYDSNAFWCKPIPLNLQIIVLNNAGGNIFKLIDGPKEAAEISEYISTPHQHLCKNLAKQHGISYSTSEDHIGSHIKLVEIFSKGNESLWDYVFKA